MKTKIFFLWLFVLLTTTAFSQNLTISAPGYPSKDCTNKTADIRSGVQVTITATLPAGATSTYWTADQALTADIPAQSFVPGIDGPAGNTVTLTMPATYSQIVITVYFNDNTPPAQPSSSTITLVRNNNPAPGLLTVQQDIVSCPNVDLTYFATTSYQDGFNYLWQEFNGSTWINLASSSYYSAINHVLSVKSDPSIVGKRFKCIVTNGNCFGAVDQTAEVIVQTVHALPTATFSSNLSVCAGDQVSLVVTPTGTVAPYTVSLDNSSYWGWYWWYYNSNF